MCGTYEMVVKKEKKRTKREIKKEKEKKGDIVVANLADKRNKAVALVHKGIVVVVLSLSEERPRPCQTV
jgi:hypothetical protein